MSAGDGGGHAVGLVALEALLGGVVRQADGHALVRHAAHVGGKTTGALGGEADVLDDAGSGAAVGGEAAGGALVELVVHGGVLSDKGVEVLGVVAADLSGAVGEGEDGEEGKKHVTELHFLNIFWPVTCEL